MSTSTVGVLGHPDLADLLREAGVEVVTGDDPASAAGAIKSAFGSGQFPVIVEDTDASAVSKWASGVAKASGEPVAVVSERRQHITDESIIHIGLPAPVFEIADRLGISIDSHQWYPSDPSATDHADDSDADEIPDFEAPDEPTRGGEPSPHGDIEWDSTRTPETSPAGKSAENTNGTRAEPQPVPQRQPVAVGADEGSDVEWDSTGGSADAPAPQTPEPAEDVPQTVTVAEPEGSAGRGDDYNPYRDGLVAAEESAQQATEDLFNTPLRRNLAPVIVPFSGKGGVSKTSTSIQVATTAAAAGLRVVLVDGNRAQSDIGTFLAVQRKYVGDMPTIADYLDTGDAKATVVTGPQIMEMRPDDAKPIPERLGVIFGADSKDERLSEVGPQTYMSAIEEIRTRVDLVVVDTQIIEADDKSGMVEGMVIPLLAGPGGFGIGLSDVERAGLTNLSKRMNLLAEAGVERSRMMVAMNMANPDAVDAMEDMGSQKFHNKLGVFLGVIGRDDRIEEYMRQGRVDLGNTEYDYVVNEALLRATNRPEFDRFVQRRRSKPGARARCRGKTKQSKNKPGLFARLLGRR